MSVTPEMLSLAREIAAQDADARGAHALAAEIRAGKCDNTIGVRIALTAIQHTTELAAKLADDQAALWKRNPSLLNGDWNEQDAMRAIECGRLAGKYRSFDHLKGASQ